MPYTNSGLYNQTPGDPAVRNLWGTNLNTNFTLIDNNSNGILSLSVAGAANVVLTSTQGAVAQYRNAHFVFTGILTGNIFVLWPSGVTYNMSVYNNTTGAFTLGIGVNSGGSPAGTTVTVPQGSKLFLNSDGTNVVKRFDQATLPSSSTDNAAARFDGTGGGTLQNSVLLIADTTGSLSRSGDGGIQLQGTNTNDNAAAGYVGEYVSSTVASGSAVALGTGVAANITSISLTAGDWDVDVNAQFTGSASTVIQALAAYVSLVSSTVDNTPGRRNSFVYQGANELNLEPNVLVGPVRLSLGSTTTVYFVVNAVFTVSTCSAFGIISARRVR